MRVGSAGLPACLMQTASAEAALAAAAQQGGARAGGPAAGGEPLGGKDMSFNSTLMAALMGSGMQSSDVPLTLDSQVRPVALVLRFAVGGMPSHTTLCCCFKCRIAASQPSMPL